MIQLVSILVSRTAPNPATKVKLDSCLTYNGLLAVMWVCCKLPGHLCTHAASMHLHMTKLHGTDLHMYQFKQLVDKILNIKCSVYIVWVRCRLPDLLCTHSASMHLP